MADELRFFVAGPPKGKERPRFTATGRPYTPDATRVYEATLRSHALAAVARAGWRVASRDHSFAVELRIRFGDLRRRDLDNVLKAVLDSMNKIVYLDDSQVSECHVYRELAQEKPGVLVCVRRRPK